MRSKIIKSVSAILSLIIIAFSAQIPLTVSAENPIPDESVFQETTSENGFTESNLQNEAEKTAEGSAENKESINVEPATLSEADRPQVISRSDVEKNGHIGRLKDLEDNLGSMAFQNKDGTCTTYFFSEPVKYADELGVIHDKESVISSYVDKMSYAEDYAYANSNNDVHVYFPKALGGDTGIILNKEDINIELTPVSSKKTGYETQLLEAKAHMNEVSAVSAAPVKRQISDDISSGSNNKDVIDYNAVFGNNTAIRYAPTLNGFKEDIVIDSYDGTSEFVFRLKTNGLRLIGEEDQYYLAEPDTLKRVVDIGALIVYSNGGKDVSVGYDHRYETETVTDNQEYLIRAIVDKDFLLDENTVYPVIVDPSFEVKSENNNIMDMSVRIDGSVVPNSRNNAVGNHNVDRVDMRTFIKIPGLLNDSFFRSLMPHDFADPSEPSINSIKLMLYSRAQV